MATLADQLVEAEGSILHVLTRSERMNRAGTETYPATLHVWLWEEGFEPAKVKIPPEYWPLFNGDVVGQRTTLHIETSKFNGGTYYTCRGVLAKPAPQK